LWEAQLEGSGHATPMTFQGRKSGRQFVVIAAGGGGYLSRHSADAVVAFALPPTTTHVSQSRNLVKGKSGN
jgi:quinoprotein glucose dehydrogenase